LDKSESVETNRGAGGKDKLRILLVVYLPWEARLGAVKVFMELEQAWRAAGHCVDIFSMDRAFPVRTSSSPLAALRQLLFNRKAAQFIRNNADRYDVVDALVGSLRASKAQLGFRGLLVARSVGLYRLYDRFEREASRRWPVPGGKAIGKIYYTMIAAWLRRASDAAIANADLVNVPNEDEAECLRKEEGARLSITVHGYGLPEERRLAFAQSAAAPDLRRNARTIGFIGALSPRKGSKDWARIVRLVWAQIPDACFLFLGTLTDDANVLNDLGLSRSNLVGIVREYQPDELPQRLSNCTAGAFPTYAEGFGFALLEQLASGIPTVAYDSPGPRSILSSILPQLLVSAGDVDQLSAALVRILRMNAPEYDLLSRQSRHAANRFDWNTIARETAQSYQDKIGELP